MCVASTVSDLVLINLVLSVDLKDAMGDRLYLSNMFTRDGVCFLALLYIVILNLSRFNSIEVKRASSTLTLPHSPPHKSYLNPESLAVGFRGSASRRRISSDQLTSTKLAPPRAESMALSQ